MRSLDITEILGTKPSYDPNVISDLRRIQKSTSSTDESEKSYEEAFEEEKKKQREKHNQTLSSKDAYEQSRHQSKASVRPVPDLTNQPCEYFAFANEQNEIHHKNVVFHCNRDKNFISLGDCSDSSAYITVSLEKGGFLRVNRRNLADLSYAISLFSAKDIGLIGTTVSRHLNLQKISEEWRSKKEQPVEQHLHYEA